MAKKNEVIDHTIYQNELLEDIMGDRFSRYAKYIIQERALPDARDGLKPVQRRILYAMYHDGNTWDHPYRKSAKTVGLVIGNYHPHGDTSVYDAMIRMSQSWKVRLPLIDVHGNNGSIDDDPAAAMRYTEARLAKVTEVMENDLDKDTVEMTPNFDDTEMEPTVLPVPFPVMLVNGATGIAAGYATNMPPHNLGEVVDATIYRLNNPECSLDELMQIIPGPDFPTGGIVQGADGIREAFATGHGRIVVRGKADIVEGRTCNQIIITEVPYEVIKSELVKRIDEIRLNRSIDGMLDVRDESDRQGLKVVIDVRKDADAQTILNYLYKNTDLQIYYNYNNVTIVDQRPVQIGLIGLLDAFINFRKEVVRRRSLYEKKQMEDRCHIIEGLMKAVSILDEVIALIRASKDKADAKKGLMETFGFDDKQAEAIVMMRLYRLSNTDIVALRNEFAELTNKIEEVNDILENENVMRSVIVKELKAVKKEYDDPRRTRIEENVSTIVIDKAATIANERVMVTVSRDGYVKRVSMKSYQASLQAGTKLTGLKEGDALIGTIECDTLNVLLLFTSKGNFAYLPVWQIDDGKWRDIGTHLNKYVRIDGTDKIVNAVLVPSFDTYAWIVTASDNGQIKRTPVRDFQLQRNTRVMTAMNLNPGAGLLAAFAVYAEDEAVLLTRDGFLTRYPITQIPVQGLKARGVKAINISRGDRLAAACVLHKEDNALTVITDGAAMKRLKVEETVESNRPSKGCLAAKRLKTHPYVMKDILSVHSGETVSFFDPEEHDLPVVDIPLKPAATTFSEPITLNAGWYRLKGIEECRVIDRPADADDTEHDEVETISLFDGEEGNG